MSVNIPRIVISGTHSGAGKSTITMGLLMALKKRGLNPQPFKAGPDYLDPMHHALILGKECRNLDTWMFPDYTERLFVKGSEGSGISVVEGAMGLYDGVDGVNEEGSTAHLSKVIRAPVILVIDSRSMARSAGAVALGFREYDRDTNIAGVIFNRVGSLSHLKMLESSLRGIPCLGGVFRDGCMVLESRHLGLVPAAEDYDQERYEKIREHTEACVDVGRIIEIAKSAPPIENGCDAPHIRESTVRIGVAMDKAFNFYYVHNLESLAEAGAEIVPFSPIGDRLPDVDGLYFGGGYPELFSAELENNREIRSAVKKVSEDGMPIYAECGGLMYMSGQMTDMEGNTHEMCGVLDANSSMNDGKRSLGYVEMEARTDSAICRKGWTVRGHEFHYSVTNPIGPAEYAFELSRGKGIENGMDGMTSNNTLAGYTHIHFASNPKIPVRFADSCHAYSRS
ncbi:MAG: hydrogenobyrinic acid a,c-diamide synthase (glutamine-hydrolyzing) [Candidatus Methanoplasma sp.]|jgi:cobyrinic acid a,c-diamide synthase|nr:hydrogenobyrinic acid a,c-diamide synthase (glutamine-hydrolyzing) [Candidatus Methanoplasma sp.]